MGNSRRSHSDEFKREAVRRVALGEYPLTHIARELGINPSLLQTWRRKLTSPDAGSVSADGSGDLEAENRRLRRENASLREDREILKKAAAFFAKESR
jgi:transposase